ncbi:sirohydrochlorin cobaltochelatase [Diplocloster agilis]|uniref:Sirohydrochlorin cobaltochelatase n=1 Tax=Diplocloster agilis TaxID=2850323 RepID=A0A949NHN1_9FIRM|nr:sirohydrochlorin cobaltochelatase [Diplocloster agilis]MBU9736410.1 sirohydrochlorin cobaltochelatase [Diplocloster agilis]
MIYDKAILLPLFGSTDHAAMARVLEPLEKKLNNAIPGCYICHCLLSSFILKKYQDSNIPELSLTEALDRIAELGIRRLIVQPLLLTTGTGYDLLCSGLKIYRNRFSHISLGRPILCDDWDYAALARAVWQEFPAPAKDEVVLLMGHGSETGDNQVYHRLTEEFLLTGHSNIFIGTMRDWGAAMETAEQWKQAGYRKVRLLPFLLIAGYHASRDMVGPVSTSWKSRLEAAGFLVSYTTKGLGEYDCVRERITSGCIRAAE